MKWYFLSLFVLLIMAASVNAVSPFQESQGEGDLQIEYPKFQHYPPDSVKMHFHVYNSSSYAYNVSHTDCYIHIYDNYGNHVLEEDLKDDTNTIDKYVNFTLPIGTYSYIVYCNSTESQYGFISDGFTVTTEYDEPKDNLGAIATLIGLLILIGSLLYISNNLTENHFLLRLLILFFVLSLFIVLGYVMLQTYTVGAGIVFKSITLIVSTTLLYVFIYFVYEVLKFKGVIGHEKEER